MTVKQLTDAAIKRTRELQREADSLDPFLTSTKQKIMAARAGREYALAIAALEDAQMRVTRGLAMVQGKFAPADLEA